MSLETDTYQQTRTPEEADAEMRLRLIPGVVSVSVVPRAVLVGTSGAFAEADWATVSDIAREGWPERVYTLVRRG